MINKLQDRNSKQADLPNRAPKIFAALITTALALSLGSVAFALPTARIGVNQWNTQAGAQNTATAQLPSSTESGSYLSPTHFTNQNSIILNQDVTENFGSSPSTPSAVPEPATGILAGLGLAITAWRRRRARTA